VGTGDVVLVVLAPAGPINSETTQDLFLPTSGDRPFYGAMVERRDGPSRLRDDDDDDYAVAPNMSFEYVYITWDVQRVVKNIEQQKR